MWLHHQWHPVPTAPWQAAPRTPPLDCSLPHDGATLSPACAVTAEEAAGVDLIDRCHSHPGTLHARLTYLAGCTGARAADSPQGRLGGAHGNPATWGHRDSPLTLAVSWMSSAPGSGQVALKEVGSGVGMWANHHRHSTPGRSATTGQQRAGISTLQTGKPGHREVK